VRRAFLDLDLDHDGFISVEDIMKYFRTDNELNFNDLKKLLVEKDT
jgi:Ca2+-binding EF-hand superfamily protein